MKFSQAKRRAIECPIADKARGIIVSSMVRLGSPHAAALEDLPPSEKGRAAELCPPDPVSDDGAFEAFLYPNRSLPNKGFALVMAVVILVNLTLGAVFYSVGAWPVIGFCGLDIFLVWAAFKLSYRQGRLHERVRVNGDEVLVSRVLPSGHETRWRVQAYWARVTIANRGKHEASVRLMVQGRTLILGSFLSPHERESFGDALMDALGRARTGV